jgi:sn-glycerol 3-phosphate transport system substrate-binding protein
VSAARGATVARGWRAAVAAATAALVLGGCGGGGDGAGQAGDCEPGAYREADGPVTVTFWHVQQRVNLEELRRQVRAFEAEHPKIRVRLVNQAGYQELFEKFKAGLTSGDLPDVAQFEETTVQQLIDSRATVPVAECVRADRYPLDDFIPRTIEYYTVRGTLHALPWPVSNPILIYDRAKFARAGLDPATPPRTFEEVRDASRRIIAAGAARHGIALRIEPYVNEFFFAKSGQPYVNNNGGRDGRATRATLDTPIGRQIWTWWKEMVDDGLALNTGGAPGNFDHLLAVGTGDAAMAIEASGALGPILDVLQSGQYPGVEIGTGPLPALRTGGGVPVGDGSLWLSKRSSPARRAAAWELIKFLEAPEQQAALAAATGYVPVRESATQLKVLQDFWAARPEFRTAYDQLLVPGGPAANGSVIGDYQGVRDAVREGLTAMLTRDIPPARALAQTERAATRAIREYNRRIGG